MIRSEQEKVPEYMSEEALDIFPAQPNAVSNKSLPTPSNTALYISKGKKDKVSKGDIVGWLCKQGGLTNEEIVRIELLDHHAYVAVPSKKAKATMTALRQTTMKGKQVLIEIAR